jgi:hypothetical protein
MQNAEHAPRSSLRSSLPPKQHFVCWGRPRDDFGVEVRFCVPSCNALLISKLLVAKRQRGVGARGQPPNLGVAMNVVKSGGHVMRSARPASKLLHAKHQPLTRSAQSLSNKKQVGPGVYPDPGPVFAVVCALVRDFWRARLSLNSRVIPLDHPPVKRTGQDSNPQPRDAGASPSTTR